MDDYKKNLEDYFCRFTFGQFVTLILIEIVTLFFVFYLGAHYGADLIGGKNAVAKRQQDGLPKEGKSVDDIVGTPPVEYTYPEVLTSADGQKAVKVKPSGMTASEYAQQEKVKEEEKPGPVKAAGKIEEQPKEVVIKEVKKPKPALSSHQVVKEVVKAPVEATPTGESPEMQEVKSDTPPEESSPPPPAPVKSAASTTAPKGKFAIQVASFQSAEEAAASVGQWKKKGYSAYMTVGEVPDKGTWYRVRLGGFKTKPDAVKFLGKLKKKEKKTGLVVLSKS